jgi:hypothetical protein
MCHRCDQISETIARYNRLSQQTNDRQVQEPAVRLAAKLKAEKLALHPKE